MRTQNDQFADAVRIFFVVISNKCKQLAKNFTIERNSCSTSNHDSTILFFFCFLMSSVCTLFREFAFDCVIFLATKGIKVLTKQ